VVSIETIGNKTIVTLEEVAQCTWVLLDGAL
jgi:hypothetical protein